MHGGKDPTAVASVLVTIMAVSCLFAGTSAPRHEGVAADLQGGMTDQVAVQILDPAFLALHGTEALGGAEDWPSADSNAPCLDTLSDPSYVSVGISATGNAPTVGSLPNPFYVSVGVPAIISIRVNDSDNDILNVTWDWGDGSPTETNTTPPAQVAVRIYNEHAWTPPIEYTQGTGDFNYTYALSVMVEDGQGNYVWRNTTVYCYIPENYGPEADITGPTSEVAPNVDTTFVAKAWDFEGEPLTWTFVFNDSATDYLTLVYNTPAFEPNTWTWNNITHAFPDEGYYNVTVYVSDALGANQTFPHNNSDRASVSVWSNEAPYCANITSSPENPVVNSSDGQVEVGFIIEIYDNEGDIVTAIWNFGDGSPTASNLTPGGRTVHTLRQNHTYTGSGAFNVTVNVTDGTPGNEVARYLVLTVIYNNLPPALTQFSYSASGIPLARHPFEGEDVCYEVVLTDAETDGIELTWDFGDGSPPSHHNLTEYDEGKVSCSQNHTYSVAGNYVITIWYTDNEVGLTNHSLEYMVSVSVVVDTLPPTADAGDYQTVFAPCVVYFDGSGSSDNWGIANYTWTFSYNGSTVVLWGPTPNFEFWTVGTYHVWLVVTDMVGYTDFAIVTIQVTDVIPEFLPVVPTLIVMIMVPLLCHIRRGARKA